MVSIRPLLRIAPLIAGVLIAMIPMEATPFMISGVMKTGGLSAEQAGWMATACVAAVALSSMAVAPIMARLPFRAFMLGAAILVAMGYAALPMLGSYISILVVSVLIGAGAGALLAGMATVIARFPDPDRVYGMIYATAGVVFAGLLYLLPVIAEATTSRTMFFTLTGLALVVSTLLIRLPRHVHDAHQNSDQVPQPVTGIRWKAVAIVVVVLIIGQPFYGGTYGFAERKALEVGLTSVQAGMILSVATLLTIVGSTLVAIVGTRWGRLVPTVVVLSLATVAYYLVLGATEPVTYVAGFLLFGFVQLGINSYLFGLASALDRTGRVSAALQGFSLIPYGLGPGLFGSIVGGGTLVMLAVPAIVFNVIAIVILIPLLRSLDRGRESTDETGEQAVRVLA